MSTTTLRDLERQVIETERALKTAIKERFTEGTLVQVRWGQYAVSAVVLDTAFDRVKVRSLTSQKEYWVHAPRIVEFYEW